MLPMNATLPLLALPAALLVTAAFADIADTSLLPDSRAGEPDLTFPSDTHIENPATTLMHRAETYTELASLLEGIKGQARGDADAERVAELVKLTMILDRQWNAMEPQLSGDQRRELHNVYENQMNDSRNKARNEAQRIRDKGFFGSVPLRKALTGFLPEEY